MKRKKKKERKKNFYKPGKTEPAMQNSVKLSLRVVKVCIATDDDELEMSIQKQKRVEFFVEIEQKRLGCLYSCSNP